MSLMENENTAEVQQSILELSKEMTLLGLQSLETSDFTKPAEVCESLLNAAWLLVHTIHCLSNCKGNTFQEERECRLLDEKCSLQAQLSKLEQQLKTRETKLHQEEETNRRLREDITENSRVLAKQERLVDSLRHKLTAQVDIHKHEIIKQQVENEHLRSLVQKQIGVYCHFPTEDKMRQGLVSLSLSDDRGQAAGMEPLPNASINRLKSSNQELISENLMLRDSLQNLHADLALVLKSADDLKILVEGSTIKEDYVYKDQLPENAFRLPLSHGISILSKLRHSQVSALNEALTCVKAYLFSQTMKSN